MCLALVCLMLISSKNLTCLFYIYLCASVPVCVSEGVIGIGQLIYLLSLYDSFSDVGEN